VYYKCVKFHKNPISRLGGVALTRYMGERTGWFLYTPQTLFAGGIITDVLPAMSISTFVTVVILYLALYLLDIEIEDSQLYRKT
jgi:hypothetical protein